MTVVAGMRAKPGQKLRLRQELERLLTPTRAEKGCIHYDLHQSRNDAALFMFHENWASEADLDAHLRSPHLQSLLRPMPEPIDGRIEITNWGKANLQRFHGRSTGFSGTDFSLCGVSACPDWQEQAKACAT